MELKELPWQEAVRTALILGTNVSMVLFIQITALERKRRPLLLISVLYGRCLLINILGGILFQTYISQVPFWNICYECLITLQAGILWIAVFYTFTGDALKILITSVAAEIYTMVLNGIVLVMVNYTEGREYLLTHAGPFQSMDLLIPLLMYGVFLPFYYLFRDKLRENREKKWKHRRFWAVFAGLYIFMGILSWWSGYANRMRKMSWLIWLMFFLLAAGAGAAGIRSWIIYTERLEKEHRLLKKQQKFLSLHRRVIDEQIQSMEENQKLIRQQMKEIENLKGQTFSKERAENYLRRLKQEYHRIKAGVYCSEWEIDAVLCYYAQRMEENKIRFHFFFGNYRKNSVKYEVLNRILIILLEEAIERNLSEKEGKRQISLTGGTVRNQVLLVLKTVRRGKFRIRKLRMYIEKDGGMVRVEKRETEICIKMLIPCTEEKREDP